jgi:hypothetical protein
MSDASVYIDGDRYATRIEFGAGSNATYYADTLARSLRGAYEHDTRLITRTEQDRVAREYRARCAEEDAR